MLELNQSFISAYKSVDQEDTTVQAGQRKGRETRTASHPILAHLCSFLKLAHMPTGDNPAYE